MADRLALIEEAKKAMQKAYAPYSRFRVGAALLCTDGSIYTGCNIENAAYPDGICAERVAVFKAVSDGKRDFEALAIISDSRGYTAPCGSCRQVLSEFCKPQLPVYLCNKDQNSRDVTLGELLPWAFTEQAMDGIESQNERTMTPVREL